MKNLKRMGKTFLIALCSLFLVNCTTELTEKVMGGGNNNYGTVVINTQKDVKRALELSEIKTAKVIIQSSDMTQITVDNVAVSNASGTITVEKVPIGKNRIVTVIAKDSSNKEINGFQIAQVLDIKAGINSVSVNWETTSLANVYKTLLLNAQNIHLYTDSQKSKIASAVPSSIKGYLVDSAKIATDFLSDSLKTSTSYILQTSSLSFNAKSVTNYKINVKDPLSQQKTITQDGVGSISNIAPGTWNVDIFNEEGSLVKTQKVTFTSGTPFDLGTITKTVIIYVKDSSAPTIWAWEEGGVELTKLQNYAWPGPKMINATGMNNPEGWYMHDVTDVATGKPITFKLNSSDPEIASGKTATFYYDGTNFYDTEPVSRSSNALLSSISINGTPLADFEENILTYNNTVSLDTESVVVSAVTKNENASIVVTPSTQTAIAQGVTKVFTITVTAEDGTTTKTYTVNVKRPVANDTSLVSISVNGKSASLSGANYVYNATGTQDSLEITSITAVPTDTSATVSYSATTATVADAGSKSFTITVQNGTKTSTYTLNVTYTKKEAVSSAYYWTNKDGKVGIEKTITSWSDWTADAQIAQSAAYDDPRTWFGIQEVPYDVYALFAAYDDTNLYVMVELVNLPDGRATFMNHDYAGSDNAWWNNRDCPIGMIFNTGKGVPSTTPLVGAENKPIWGSIDFSDSNGFDAMFYHSSKYGTFEGKHVGVGTPGYFKTTAEGVFSYDADHCLSFTGATQGTSGITVNYQRQCAVSKTIYFESTPTGNRAESNQTAQDLLDSTNYTAVETNDLDMSYWYTIPLSTLGIDKAYLTSHGIKIRQITPNGGSLMDCCPWDPSMVDVVTEPCSDDESTSKEKEDKDEMTTPMACIGKM